MQEYSTFTYPRSRRATFDVGIIGRRKHHIVGLLEVDVTEAKRMLDEAIRSGRKVSFTSWVLKVIADTVAANKNVHAINRRGRSQVAFTDVDIAVPIERKVDGVRVPLVTVIRKGNEKNIEEIAAEIRKAFGKPIRGSKEYVLENSGGRLNALFFRMPQFLRLLVWKFMLSSPFIRKETMGTVMVSNISISGNFPGWIVPRSMHNLAFGIGAVVPKPWVRGGNIEVRDIMNLTVMFDHDVVDGSPAARFVDKLVKNFESPGAI